MPSSQPLTGHVVVEIGHSVAAPYAGLILAELGAEVIKVENPNGGDAARGWGPPFIDGVGPHFRSLNRNKKSIAVDLSDDNSRDGLKALILNRADVVICNLRAGVASRFGLGASDLLGLKPMLIYCDVSAFGSGGPLSQKPGYDPLMQAFCGIMSVTGESLDRPPIRVGVSMIDMGAGMWAAIGILGTLIERRKTRKGGHIETSLFETAIAWANTPITRFLMGGGEQRPQGSGAAGIVPYQAFQTETGWLVIGAGNDSLFVALCGAMNRSDLAEDPRFRRNGDRVMNQHELLPIIIEFAGRYTTKSLSKLLDAAGVPNAPVQTISQVVETPQTKALHLIQECQNAVSTVGLPLRFDGIRPSYVSGAPALGVNTDEILGPTTR